MPDDARAELDRLRATVDTLVAERGATRAEVAALRRLVARPRQRRALLPALCLALLVALVPLAVLAATPFTDLTGGVHDSNIDAIYNAGITTGCDPTHYCPKDTVTREEMASFLARTAGLGTNPPVANAAQLGGVPAEYYLQRGAADFAILTQVVLFGPLPRSTSFTSHGGRLLLFVSGSAYGTGAGEIGVVVKLDEFPVTYLQVGTNETLSHKALVPVLRPVSRPAGEHTITFALNTGLPLTGTDGYDSFNLTVLELPFQ